MKPITLVWPISIYPYSGLGSIFRSTNNFFYGNAIYIFVMKETYHLPISRSKTPLNVVEPYFLG